MSSLLLSHCLSYYLIYTKYAIIYHTFLKPASVKYADIIFSPHSIEINIPAAKYGPIASLLPAFVTFIRIRCITEPMMHPKKNANVIFCQPIARPAHAMSLTSPPPMALPPLTRRRISRNKLTQKNPITYSDQLSWSKNTCRIPSTSINILIPNGISYVLQSITLRTMSADVRKQ